jgi:glycerol-3-phosphate acyltransferase PlsX
MSGEREPPGGGLLPDRHPNPDRGHGRVRVALDLMGGDQAPGVVADAALLVHRDQPEVELVLVGRSDVAAEVLAARDATGAFEVVAAAQVVGMGDDPARTVRAKRDASVRIGAELVRDGRADAFVSAGNTGATMAAALFTLGRVPGMTRTPLAAVVPAANGPVVLLDAGATVDAGPEMLLQFALAGAAYAAVRLGIEAPRVALLSIGSEAGKGDELRRAAYPMLEAAPIEFVGNVEGHDVAMGGRADVVVTDGFSGNVLLKAMEGTARLLGDPNARLDPDVLGGATLLGVPGVVVVAHGGARPAGIAAAVRLAAEAVRERLVPRVTESLARMVSDRRHAAGLAVEVGT